MAMTESHNLSEVGFLALIFAQYVNFGFKNLKGQSRFGFWPRGQLTISSSFEINEFIHSFTHS